MSYESGIYRHMYGLMVGGHAVKVVGYGQEGKVSFWIVANSWGEDWGEKGFFRIEEGECDFEKQLISGTPAI